MLFGIWIQLRNIGHSGASTGMLTKGKGQAGGTLDYGRSQGLTVEWKSGETVGL